MDKKSITVHAESENENELEEEKDSSVFDSPDKKNENKIN